MSQYIDGVDQCYEVYNTIQESYQLSSASASVQLRCPWDKRYEVVLKALEGGLANKPIDFIHQPAGEGSKYGSQLRATGVNIVPMLTNYQSEDEKEIEYKYALITISYGPLVTDFSIESTMQFMTINHAGLYWDARDRDGHVLAITPNEAPGIPLGTYDISLTHPHMKLTVDGGNLNDFDGYCNADDIVMKYNGYTREYEAETLFCNPPSIHCSFNLQGSGFWQVSLKLSYNPLGHNQWFHPLKTPDGLNRGVLSQRVSMYRDPQCSESSRVKPIPTKDFTPLFRAFGVTPAGNG